MTESDKLVSMEAALKPCPFCGGKANPSKQSGGSDERWGYNFTVAIECADCGTSIVRKSHQGSGGWCDDKGEARAEVIAAWNTRQSPDALKQVRVEAMRECLALVTEIATKGLGGAPTCRKAITKLIEGVRTMSESKVVPVEANAEMNFAGYDACGKHSTVKIGLSTISKIYAAMIEAAPTAAPTEVERLKQGIAVLKRCQNNTIQRPSGYNLSDHFNGGEQFRPYASEFEKAIEIAERLIQMPVFWEEPQWGVRLVPVEPTPEMIEAGCVAILRDSSEEDCRLVYAAMIAAHGKES